MPRAMKRGFFAAVVISSLAAFTPVRAQSPTLTAPEAAAAHDLDTIAATLTQLDSDFRDRSAANDDLQDLRDRATPLVADAQSVLDRLTGRLNAVKTRLDQLGPPPDPKTAHEPAEVTQERQQQQQEYDAADALVKRAKLLLVQAQQLAAHIATRQHQQFTRSLLERSPSIVDPDFWINAATMTPGNASAVATSTGDWIKALDVKLKGWRAPAFWLLFVGLVAWGVVIILTLPRRLFRMSDSQSRHGSRKSCPPGGWCWSMSARLCLSSSRPRAS